MKNKFRKGWVVSVIILLIGISIAPVVNANINRILPPAKYNGESDEGDSVEVTCQVSTFRGVNQIDKKISRTRLDKISTLIEIVSGCLNEKSSLSTLQDKISELVVELEVAGLLPQSLSAEDTTDFLIKGLSRSIRISTSFNNLRKRINFNVGPSGGWNFLSFIFGVGQKTSIGCPRGTAVSYVFAILDSLLLNLKEVPWELISKLNTLNDFLYFRTRALIPIGGWLAKDDGSITTIGTNGVCQWSENQYVGTTVYFNGFSGIALRSEESTGFIIGFSLLSKPDM